MNSWEIGHFLVSGTHTPSPQKQLKQPQKNKKQKQNKTKTLKIALHLLLTGKLSYVYLLSDGGIIITIHG